MPSLGLVANVYNEANALPGWLETHLPFFDDVRILHAGPQGAYSDDGTIELLEKWKIPIEYCAIDDGFGVVRTRAIRMSPCDWVMILDADERFYPLIHLMNCEGESTPHSEVDSILRSYDCRPGSPPVDWDRIGRLGSNLKVVTNLKEVWNQGGFLRHLITESNDAIMSIRRHWHDFSFKRPTQNWHHEPDWQLRIVRNNGRIGFDPSVKMHERLEGSNIRFRPDTVHGIFFDHFHFTFKRMEEKQRSHDVMIYDALHQGKEVPKSI